MAISHMANTIITCTSTILQYSGSASYLNVMNKQKILKIRYVIAGSKQKQADNYCDIF